MTRRLIAWAVRLYPSAWRERYGDEFAATVEDMPAPGWAAVWDAWKGAMAMRTHYGAKAMRHTAIFGAVGLLAAWGISTQIPDIYVSELQLRAAHADPATVYQSLRRGLSRPLLEALMEKHRLYAAERSRLPLEDLIEKMKNNISVTPPAGRDTAQHIFTIGFVYEDPAISQHVTDDLAATLVRENLPSSAAVLAPASQAGPIYPNRPLVALIGLATGILLGAAMAVWRSRNA